MNVPKVKFQLPTAEQEAETLVYFCKPGEAVWDWSAVIYKNHPELEVILKDKKPDELYTYTLGYVKKHLEERKSDLEERVQRYQREWDAINDPYLTILSNHFETEYPKDRKVITAYISIVPMFPRYLDDWAFNVTSRNSKEVVPICFHEILHFVYFKKWMEVFPETKKEDRDSPHLVWRLSEILDPIILNNNQDIQALCKAGHGQYSEFRKMQIEGKPLVDHFENLYKKHLANNESFEDFLKICWGEALKYREILEGV